MLAFFYEDLRLKKKFSLEPHISNVWKDTNIKCTHNKQSKGSTGFYLQSKPDSCMFPFFHGHRWYEIKIQIKYLFMYYIYYTAAGI
jgi:hypothetical protein